MEAGSVAMVYHRTFKPQGKMRRRIKDLRIASFSCLGRGAQPDLSHNESVRLAVDSLLTQGLEAYHKILSAEGEVDFLSELEKSYVLHNGMDVCADSAPDASNEQSESSSVFSETALTYRRTSAGSDQTLTTSGLNGATSSDRVQDEPTVQIYFPSDLRASGIKDVVRSVIGGAKLALAIVMECFSDVELLCDILVACRKRSVSVHLLLDRSNLGQFVDMWQELQLDGDNFPRFSVRSVVGHTYCARTGRRLTGRMAESFVISDWTEVLTGTYSFSWLSGQVHRCHAVLIKGSAVLPFHQEFHRLNSSSTPVPGFATCVSVPQTLPLYIYNSVHQQLDLAEGCAPRASNLDSVSSDPMSDCLMSTVHSELSSLTITSAAGQDPDSSPQPMPRPPLSRQDRPPCLKSYLEPEVVEGPGTQQRQRPELLEAPGAAVRPTMPRRDWSRPLNIKPRLKLHSACSRALSPSIPVQKDKNAGFPSFLTHAKEHILKASSHRQNPANRYCQQTRPLVSAPAPSFMGAQYKPGSMLLSPDSRAKRDAQLRPAAWTSSVRSSHEARQPAGQRLSLVPLKRSLSLNDRRHILQRVQEHY